MFPSLPERDVRRLLFFGESLTDSLNEGAASSKSPNKKHHKEQAAKLLGDPLGWDVTILEMGRTVTAFNLPERGRKGRVN